MCACLCPSVSPSLYLSLSFLHVLSLHSLNVQDVVCYKRLTSIYSINLYYHENLLTGMLRWEKVNNFPHSWNCIPSRTQSGSYVYPTAKGRREEGGEGRAFLKKKHKAQDSYHDLEDGFHILYNLLSVFFPPPRRRWTQLTLPPRINFTPHEFLTPMKN